MPQDREAQRRLQRLRLAKAGIGPGSSRIGHDDDRFRAETLNALRQRILWREKVERRARRRD